jgi:hypothetical protein
MVQYIQRKDKSRIGLCRRTMLLSVPFAFILLNQLLDDLFSCGRSYEGSKIGHYGCFDFV